MYLGQADYKWIVKSARPLKSKFLSLLSLLSFDGADLVCIRKPPLLKKVPPAEWFSSEKLVQDLKKRGRDAYFFEDTEGIIEFLAQTARAGDVVLIMSNGGFDNIHERLLASL